MKEAITDLPQRNLDSQVFILDGDTPSLNPEIRQQLLDLATTYTQWGKVFDVYLIGSILTKQYTAEADMDVTLLMEPYSRESYRQAREYAGANWDKDFAIGTEHPINMFVRDEWVDDLADQIYDVIGNKWIKHTELKPFSVEDYFKSFEKYVSQIDLVKGELERDIIDLNRLKQFSSEDLDGLRELMQTKLEEIDSDVKQLVGSYKTIHAIRKLSFNKVFTPEEIKEFQIKNRLPANIVYKLLERYHYTKILGSLADVLKQSSGEIDKPSDVDDIELALKGEAQDILNSVISELTGSGAAGAYEVPLGARPQGQVKARPKRRKRKKKEEEDNV